MKNTNNPTDLRKEFVRELRAVSQAYSLPDIFRDACRCMAISLASPLLKGEEKKRVEDEYLTYVEKYGKAGMDHIATILRLTVEALEAKRQDFLGHIMEEIGASNQKGTDQYLTPDSVARVMARCTVPTKPEPGKIVTFNDPTAGAGALLIESAEEFILNGGRQGDILLYAQDLDYNAFNICFTQLSLLGYPAIVTRQDTLSMQVYEGPWYTMGYFAHGLPMRLASDPNHGDLIVQTTKDEEAVRPSDDQLRQDADTFRSVMRTIAPKSAPSRTDGDEVEVKSETTQLTLGI